MKYGLTLLASSVLLFTLNASEFIQPSDENQFPYIKPTAIEYTDRDGDGIADSIDKCPETPLGIIVDEKGCELDSDGDGVVDSKDNCPDTPLETTVDEKGCELDSDGDGVVDSKDACPDTPLETTVDEKGCELDSDRYGVFDSKDKCPNTPKGFQVDGDGCPLTTTLDVHFPINEYAVPNDDMAKLENFSQFLNKNPEYQVIISGHTDSSGNEYKNKILSKNRANSGLKALVKLGVDKNKITAIGKASTMPVADNATVEGRAQNRRIEAEILTNQ